ncbi:MAG TPA: glycosyltransferase [Kineosporiaceae bacterium]|nr:glycosyltransferase [Kineosporiaceae bacterium]
MSVPNPDTVGGRPSGEGPAPTAARRVVVAVLTFRRPQDLAELLPVLAGQCTAVEGGRRWSVHLLVVDNDPERSGEPVCAASGVSALRYAHEPAPGIAAARNRALAEATGDDVLVFIDDDERPGPDWLQRLLDTYEETGRVGVVGPVVSTFPAPLPPWVEAGRFFDRRRLATGSLVDVAATNNLLLDLHRVRACGVTFDPALGLSGGSDTLFVRRLVRAEGPLVWCDEAPVTDVVPAARCTRAWVTRRAFRTGNSWSRTAVMLEPGPGPRLRRRVVLTAAGAARLVAGLLRLLAGTVPPDLGRRAAGTRTLLRGAGMIAGAWGYTYVEYRRRSRTG